MTADNESRRRAIAGLSTSQRLRLEALFTAKPDAKVAIVSASPGHSIAGAVGRSTLAGPLSIHAAARMNPALAREAANSEAQDARERFWASLDRRPSSIVMAPVGHHHDRAVKPGAPGRV